MQVANMRISYTSMNVLWFASDGYAMDLSFMRLP